MKAGKRPTHRGVSRSLKEYARGVAGGLLFSLPLLYTMELWNAGHVARSPHLIFYLFVIFALLLGYNQYAGMRRDANWAEVAVDSIEEMGIGLVLAALTLWLSGRIGSGLPLQIVVGEVVIAAMTVAVGVSVGTAQLGGDDEEDSKDVGKEGDRRRNPRLRIGRQLTIAVCGAVLFAANIGPTEEIQIIAFETTSPKLAALALATILLGAIVLYYSDFSRSREHARFGKVESVLADAVITYAVALAVSAAILASLGRFQGFSAVSCFSQMVVLALPAALGASAGRLLLQQAG